MGRDSCLSSQSPKFFDVSVWKHSICYILPLFITAEVTCQGTRLYLASRTTHISINTRYKWAEASHSCAKDNHYQLEEKYLREESPYWHCLEKYIFSIIPLVNSSMHVWSRSCNANVYKFPTACGIRVFNQHQPIYNEYRPNWNVMDNSYALFSVCSKREFQYVMKLIFTVVLLLFAWHLYCDQADSVVSGVIAVLVPVVGNIVPCASRATSLCSECSNIS